MTVIPRHRTLKKPQRTTAGQFAPDVAAVPLVQFVALVPFVALAPRRSALQRGVLLALLLNLGPTASALASTSAKASGAAAVTSAGTAAGTAPAQPVTAPAMAGDLIVKFRNESSHGALMSDVLAGKAALPQAAPMATSLSGELGVPLVLVRVTSGREALLAIDRQALATSLAQRASHLAGVKSAKPVPEKSTGLPPAQVWVQLALRKGVSADDVARRLATAPHFAPQGPRDAQQGSEASARIGYDLSELTTQLLARLQQRGDVEYAQANRLLRAVAPEKPR
jgi:hypothetical protein